MPDPTRKTVRTRPNQTLVLRARLPRWVRLGEVQAVADQLAYLLGVAAIQIEETRE